MSLESSPPAPPPPKAYGNSSRQYSVKNLATCKTPLKKTLVLEELPEFLIFRVNRFSQDNRGRRSKLTHNFNICESVVVNGSTYRHVGHVNHIGQIGSGHYECEVRGEGGKWSKYSDDVPLFIKCSRNTKTQKVPPHYLRFVDEDGIISRLPYCKQARTTEFSSSFRKTKQANIYRKRVHTTEY